VRCSTFATSKFPKKTCQTASAWLCVMAPKRTSTSTPTPVQNMPTSKPCSTGFVPPVDQRYIPHGTLPTLKSNLSSPAHISLLHVHVLSGDRHALPCSLHMRQLSHIPQIHRRICPPRPPGLRTLIQLPHIPNASGKLHDAVPAEKAVALAECLCFPSSVAGR